MIKLKYIFIIFFFVSCSEVSMLTKQSKRYYENKQYYLSLQAACNALSLDVTYKKAILNILKVFPEYVENNLNEIKKLNEESSIFVDENTVVIKKKIIELYTDIEKFQNKIQKFKINIDIHDYTEEIKLAKSVYETSLKEAADFCYKKGDYFVKLGGIDNNKTAAKWYKKTNNYISNYKDANNKYNKAKSAGLKRIAILPFENVTKNLNYDFISESIAEGITKDLINDKEASEFVEIITRQYLNTIISEQKLQYNGLFDEKKSVQIGKIAGINELLVGKITNVIVDPGQITSNSYKIINDHYLEGYKKVKNSKGEWVKGDPIYSTHEGYVTKYLYKASAKIQCSYSFIDIETGKVKTSQEEVGQFDIENIWGKFAGSEKVFESSSGNVVLDLIANIASKPNAVDYQLCHRPEPYKPTMNELLDKALQSLKQKINEKILLYAK